jgi:hypothetical protein
MPKQPTRRPPPETATARRRAPSPSPSAAILLRIAVALEAQGERLERIEALALDNTEPLQSLAELLRQLIAGKSGGSQ